MDTSIQPVPRPDLEALFQPRSIVVAGVSSRGGGFAQSMTNGFVAALLEQRFDGPLYAVNPKISAFMGLPCYPSLRDVPEERIDYVISGVPASAALDLLDACGEKGVRLVTFFTAGFSETEDAERTALERRIVEKARTLGIRIIGPNCMGLYNPRAKVAFMPSFPKEPGRLAFISQSGANAGEFARGAATRGVRFSWAVSYGNAVDITEADLFELAGSDPNTTMVAAYIEGVRDGRRFAHALRAAGLRKPTVILKGGRTEAGGRAARSHTGSMAGTPRVFDALCRQAAATRVDSMDELIDACVAFSFLGEGLAGSRLRSGQALRLRSGQALRLRSGQADAGRGIAVVGGGGGPTVLAADDVDGAGLRVPPLSAAAQAALMEFTPAAGTSVRNPVDTSVFHDPDLVRRTLEIVAADPAIDLVLYHIGFGGMPGTSTPSLDAQIERTLAPVREAARATGTPIALVARSPMSAESYDVTVAFQERAANEGFATFPSIARAARAIAAVLGRRELLASEES